MLLLLMVALFAPRGTCFTVKDNDVEECVQEQDGIGPDRLRVEQCRLWGAIHRVGEESGLDHDQGVGGVLSIQNVSIVGCLIRTGA